MKKLGINVKKNLPQFILYFSGITLLVMVTLIPFVPIRTNEVPTINKVPYDIKLFYIKYYSVCAGLLVVSIFNRVKLDKRKVFQITATLLTFFIILLVLLIRYPYNLNALYSAYTGEGRDFFVSGKVPVSVNPLGSKITLGMTKPEVEAVLGKPSYERHNEWRYSYYLYEGTFTIKFDSKGVVIGRGFGEC